MAVRKSARKAKDVTRVVTPDSHGALIDPGAALQVQSCGRTHTLRAWSEVGK